MRTSPIGWRPGAGAAARDIVDRVRGTEWPVVVAVVVGGALVGMLSVARPGLAAVMLAAMVGLFLVARRPVTIAVLAVPGSFVVQRIGAAASSPGSAGGISYSDALIAVAAVLSLPALAGTGSLSRLRTAVTGVVTYLVTLIPTLLLNWSARADLEWLHRGILLGGGLLVGAWLVHERSADAALQLLLWVAGLLGLAAIADSLSHGLAAAQPLELNKNFLGSLLGMVAVLAIAIGPPMQARRPVRILLVALCLGGLLATQSRGAMIGAAFGLVVVFFADVRRHRVGARVLMLTIFGALVVTAGYLIRQQLLLTQSDFANSSAGLRLTVEAATRRIWSTSPVVGVGLRYYDSGLFGSGAVAANNVIDSELAESGLIGAAGFVLLQLSVVVALWRRRRQAIATAALGLVLGQLLHGMVDIYWAAGVVSLPMVVAGMALRSDDPISPRAGRSRAP